MGIRCTQPQGLPSEAEDFLRENAAVLDRCGFCGRHNGYDTRKIGETGMFDDLPILEYRLKNGCVAQEFVQLTIWDCGPMIWMGLKVGDKEFRWNEDTIESLTGESFEDDDY